MRQHWAHICTENWCVDWVNKQTISMTRSSTGFCKSWEQLDSYTMEWNVVEWNIDVESMQVWWKHNRSKIHKCPIHLRNDRITGRLLNQCLCGMRKFITGTFCWTLWRSIEQESKIIFGDLITYLTVRTRILVTRNYHFL